MNLPTSVAERIKEFLEHYHKIKPHRSLNHLAPAEVYYT
jgi:transposase InsO family protein